MKIFVKRVIYAAVLSPLINISWSLAQDPYQLLRESSEGFESVVPGRTLIFPRDHYPHEDFKIEWWYLTANLKDANGSEYGCLLYTSPSPRDRQKSRMPSSA